MKILKSIILSAAGLIAFTSCNDWLNVNTDPNTPSAESNTVQNMLGWCQFYENGAYWFGGMRVNMMLGYYTMNSRTSTYGAASQWVQAHSASTGFPSCNTTPYQWFFVGAGSNLGNGSSDEALGGMYAKAMKQGAWHYAAAAKFLRAYGFMLMTDLYGETPYTEGLGESALPAYDSGKTIFLGCLNELDEAIELFQKTQDPTLPTLALGDSWNGGDVNKWLKMCYLMKARWINHLIKKGAGSYKDGKYDVNTILDCLSKAQQSNADNTVMIHNDNAAPTHDVLGWDEPVDYCPLFSVMGMNSNYYVTKNYVDNLTNFGGFGIEDPRADKFIPWAMSHKSANSPEDLVFKGDWRRSIGVDMHTGVRLTKSPYSTSYNASKGGWYCDSKDNKNDTVYIQGRGWSKGYHAKTSMIYFMGADQDNLSGMSSMFWVRPSSPSYIASYWEACFIKAEVLFRKGSKGEAFAAYKDGVKASIEAVNDQLKKWNSEDAGNANLYKGCPSFAPMDQAAIDNYLNNGIGNASNLTLGMIMTQKKIAMGQSIEVYNDMRRYDYDKSIFLGWDVPYEYTVTPTSWDYYPVGSFPRRWPQCSHEINYNVTNLTAIGAQVPGARMTNANGEGQCWNDDRVAKDVWAIPVWWDSNQE